MQALLGPLRYLEDGKHSQQWPIVISGNALKVRHVQDSNGGTATLNSNLGMIK